MSDDKIIKQALNVLAREEARAAPPFARIVRPHPSPRRWEWRVGVAVAAVLVPMAIVLVLLLRPVVRPEFVVAALPLEPFVTPPDLALFSNAPDFESSLRLAREFSRKEASL